MGRLLKALVMTLLIMEITTIVDLTAVWTVLAELHVPQTFVNIALAISVAGLAVLTVMVFRRAMRAESQHRRHRQAGDNPVEPVEGAEVLHRRGTLSCRVSFGACGWDKSRAAWRDAPHARARLRPPYRQGLRMPQAAGR